jgi:prepilin-type N-terminal cleavage/methylation domain-containing protein
MKRRGFTLVQVMVALSIGSMVVLIAHRLFAAIVDGTHRLTEARVALDRAANARRWLVEAFGSLDVGSSQAGGFYGRSNSVEFGSWLLSDRGWLEQRRIVLGTSDRRLVAWVAPDSVVLGDSVVVAEFDYLLDPGASAVWVREWLSSVSAPLAVRVRIERAGHVDTLLFAVGTRG